MASTQDVSSSFGKKKKEKRKEKSQSIKNQDEIRLTCVQMLFDLFKCIPYHVSFYRGNK